MSGLFYASFHVSQMLSSCLVDLRLVALLCKGFVLVDWYQKAASCFDDTKIASDPIAYAPIAKLEKFTGKENNAQVWLNNMEKAIAANGWNDTRAILINKLQDFNVFKIEFLRYFSNNNSISRLANTFTTIKQGENEAVTTYLECFHRNLHQIQAIDANYFTVAQILNQFIHGLCSSILQCVHAMHPVNLQAAVTNARDFEATKLEANHAQAVNLIMNGSSELDSKLKQFNESINQKLERYLNQLHLSSLTNQQWQQETCVCYYCELLTYDAAATLSITSISNANLSTDDTSNLSAAATTHLSATVLNNISASTNSNTTTKLTSKWNPKAKIDPTKLEIIDGTESRQQNLGTGYAQNPNSQNYLSLLVTPKDAQPNNLEPNQHPTLTSNIPPTTITENKSLDVIFSFKLEELSTMPLFSGAILEKKPITAMYTDAKVNDHSIKLILNSGLAGSIITKQFIDQLGHQVDHAASAKIITANRATKTSIGEIDHFSFEVNGIIIPIKVLVMEATQYQTLIGNNWCYQ
ncbi:hypothetical protein G9A89_001979 [Geosiphon pyriformis]|nr:hypothetical protein G9A89_001979 [Geosiphon pyriformis]